MVATERGVTIRRPATLHVSVLVWVAAVAWAVGMAGAFIGVDGVGMPAFALAAMAAGAASALRGIAASRAGLIAFHYRRLFAGPSPAAGDGYREGAAARVLEIDGQRIDARNVRVYRLRIPESRYKGTVYPARDEVWLTSPDLTVLASSELVGSLDGDLAGDLARALGADTPSALVLTSMDSRPRDVEVLLVSAVLGSFVLMGVCTLAAYTAGGPPVHLLAGGVGSAAALVAFDQLIVRVVAPLGRSGVTAWCRKTFR